MIEFKKPADAVQQSGIKMLIYGPPGVGKTLFCCSSGDKTLLISAEAGLLSIKDTSAPVEVYEIHTYDQLVAIYQHLKAGTDFKAFYRVDAEHGLAEIRMELVEHRFSESGRHVADVRPHNAPETVALLADFVNAGKHLFRHRRSPHI